MTSPLKAFYDSLPEHFESIVRNGTFIGYKCLECGKMICPGHTYRGNHIKAHLRKNNSLLENT